MLSAGRLSSGVPAGSGLGIPRALSHALTVSLRIVEPSESLQSKTEPQVLRRPNGGFKNPPAAEILHFHGGLVLLPRLLTWVPMHGQTGQAQELGKAAWLEEKAGPTWWVPPFVDRMSIPSPSPSDWMTVSLRFSRA